MLPKPSLQDTNLVSRHTDKLPQISPSAIQAKPTQSSASSTSELRTLSKNHYVIPKSALGYFPPGAHLWTLHSGLDEEYAQAMGMDKQQAQAVSAAVLSTLQKVTQLEAANSNLVTDSNGNQFFAINNYNGNALRDELTQKIHDVVPGGAADFIADTILRIPELGGLGTFPQEVAIEEKPQPGGGVLLGVNVTFKHDINGLSRGYFTTNLDLIKMRFGSIYEKAGITFPTTSRN